MNYCTIESTSHTGGTKIFTSNERSQRLKEIGNRYASTGHSLPSQYLLFFKAMLEPGKASLKADQTRCFAREHKTELSYIVVNETARLIHFRQQFHFLASTSQTDYKTARYLESTTPSYCFPHVFINFTIGKKKTFQVTKSFRSGKVRYTHKKNRKNQLKCFLIKNYQKKEIISCEKP